MTEESGEGEGKVGKKGMQCSSHQDFRKVAAPSWCRDEQLQASLPGWGGSEGGIQSANMGAESPGSGVAHW